VNISIIHNGDVIALLTGTDLEQRLPTLPANVDTVNLTWEAGDEQVSDTYQFTTFMNNLNASPCI